MVAAIVQKYTSINNDILTFCYWFLLAFCIFLCIARTTFEQTLYKQTSIGEFIAIATWAHAAGSGTTIFEKFQVALQSPICNPENPDDFDYSFLKEYYKFKDGACGPIPSDDSGQEPMWPSPVNVTDIYLCEAVCRRNPPCYYFTIGELWDTYSCYMWSACNEDDFLETLASDDDAVIYTSYKLQSTPYSYKNIACIELCMGRDSRLNCTSENALYEMKSNTEVWILTHYQEKLDLRGQAYASPVTDWFNPIPESITVACSYNFEFPNLGPRWLGGPRYISGTSTKNIYTQLLICPETPCSESDYVTGKLIPPGTLEMQATEIFTMAGSSVKQFNEPQVAAGKNMAHTGKHRDGPIGRLSGMEFRVTIECMNEHSYEHLQRPSSQIPNEVLVGDEMTPTYLCYMKAEKVSKEWVSDRRQEIVDINGSLRSRQIHGMMVTFRGEGKFRFADPDGMISTFVFAVVMCLYPGMIASFVAAHLLGRLSTIYHKAIYVPFKLRDVVASCVLRMLANGVTFCTLDDGHGVGIKSNIFRKRLQLSIESSKSGMETREISALSKLCYICIDRFRPKKVERKGDETEAEEEKETASDLEASSAPDDFIGQETYDRVLSTGKRLDFADIVSLFDSKNRGNVLERLFTPRFLREAQQQGIDLTISGFGKYRENEDSPTVPNGKLGFSRTQSKLDATFRIGSPEMAAIEQYRKARREMDLEEKKIDLEETVSSVALLLERSEENELKLKKLLDSQHKNLKATEDYAEKRIIEMMKCYMWECNDISKKLDELADDIKHHEDELEAAEAQTATFSRHASDASPAHTPSPTPVRPTPIPEDEQFQAALQREMIAPTGLRNRGLAANGTNTADV